MPNPNVTITDIEITEFRAWKEVVTDFDTQQETTHWYASVGYRVVTDDPDWTWPEMLTQELAGPIKTKAADLHSSILAFIKSQKGIS